MQNRNASFWNPENGQDPSVIRHAPDDGNYHYPDGRQLERMRSGMGEPVLVPKARSDGSSTAFDGSKAGVVHVDPNAPDGGVIVDLTQLRKADVNQALRTSRFPHEVFYKLGVSPLDVENESQVQRPRSSPRVNPLIGSGYVVPASDIHGRQIWEQPANEDYGNFQMAYPVNVKEASVLPAAPQLQPIHPQQQVPQQQQAPQATQVGGPAPYPAAYPPQNIPPMYHPQQGYPPGGYQQPFYPPPPPPVDPNIQAMLGQLIQGMTTLSNRVAAVEDQPAPSRPVRNHRGSGVATLPVGNDRQQEYAGRSVPLNRQKRRRPEEEEGEGDNLYAKEAKTPIFEDDEQEIGQRKSGNERSRTNKRRTSVAPQHLDDYIEDDEFESTSHREGIIVGFESLKMPYVSGPHAVKPKRKVVFDFGDSGKLAATYHDVIESINCVVLVYDTRYDEGTQFEPPDFGSDRVIEVHVASLKKTYRVGSIGQSFSLGVFDCVVLVKVDNDEQLDYNEE